VVAGVQNDAPAEGTLEAGDVVLALDGKERESIEAYQRATAATPAGEDVRLRIERDGETLEVQVPTEQVDGDSRMGIMLAPGYDFPIEVTITVDGIGGPSAGTMFALSIYDELTPGDLTGGQSIAGTGTIDSEGAVGPIGGIRQKLVGARSQGADYFLAPGANCEQVVGHVPDGLAVVRVDTFDDALEAVRTIGETGDASTLPSCDT
ncbi:MAG: PDZ domain-containing protein, partial [Brachybacterium sp.]|nr:PDZ domain-containing protein [Brachybacterium sp.]